MVEKTNESGKPERILTPRQWATIGRVSSTGNSTGPHIHFEVPPDEPDDN